MTLFPGLEAPDDHTALQVDDQRVSWTALAAACEAMRRRLDEARVPPGAHVAVWTQSHWLTPVALVAVAASGRVLVPLDPKLGEREMGHLNRDAAPVVAFAAEPDALQGRITGAPTWPVPLQESPGAGGFRRVDDAPLLVLYTSGTTGLPKGAVLSSRNVGQNLDALAEAWAWTRADTVVHALPLFHVHGLVLGLFGAIRHGGGLRWLTRFDPSAVATALSGQQSMLFAVPTMYHRLADAAEADPDVARGLSSARVLGSGSAALALRDQKRIEALTGQRVLERYGLTETVINCAVRFAGERRAGTVGPALAGVEVRLVDETRAPMEVHDDAAIGEVAVRGHNVFLGYLGNEAATRAVMDEAGWFYTGDLATLSADGTLRIVGRRATDLIKCGGYKVGAGEVEAALLEHPDVAEAAVLGAPDDDLGERIVAFVVVRRPVAPQVLIDFVAAQASPHKRPRAVHFVDALPRNAMGKVQKVRLREQLVR